MLNRRAVEGVDDEARNGGFKAVQDVGETRNICQVGGFESGATSGGFYSLLIGRVNAKQQGMLRRLDGFTHHSTKSCDESPRRFIARLGAMVSEAVEPPQHALLLGIDPADQEAVETAARSAGLEAAYLADVAGLTHVLDSLETPVACLIVDAFDSTSVQQLAALPPDARIATVPVLAR